MRDLTSEAKGYDINFTYQGKVFHINSSRLGQTREKLKQFGIEVYQDGGENCIYLPVERKVVGEITILPYSIRLVLKQVEDCTNFSSVFWDSNFQLLDLSGWDVSQGKFFTWMFNYCKYLKTLNLNGWDVSQGMDFYGMFNQCESLEFLDLSDWDVRNGEFFSHMFESCSSLKFLNLSSWDISQGKEFIDMFGGCNSLRTVKAEGCNEFTIKRLRELLPSGCEVVY